MGHVALYVLQLRVLLLVDSGRHQSELIGIPSHAASYSYTYWFYVLFSNMSPGSHFWYLELQSRSGVTGVYVAAPRVGYWLKRLSFRLIPLQFHLVEVFLEP
jgi:hypothetical protein